MEKNKIIKEGDQLIFGGVNANLNFFDIKTSDITGWNFSNEFSIYDIIAIDNFKCLLATSAGLYESTKFKLSKCYFNY
jgi:hypothetical protein